ncbi:FAD-dependent oxidoreductase [Piscinibacter sp.]|uniref:FAD-dependent oxidoreductase n=1 Tax=Piscinibacter sp. TaxID=1903157 RepID=UPI0039E6B983
MKVSHRDPASGIRVNDCRPASHLECDLLVVGGGAAGVAVATTAARQGLDVLLVERYGFCGGGAVAGLSGTVCGLYEASRNAGSVPRQVVFGFADEFLRRLADKGGVTSPVRYGQTYTRVHEPHVWRETADRLLAEAGVRVLLHTLVTEVLTEGGERIAGAIASTKQGKLDIRARLTIDASGDADIAAMAGLATFMGDNGRIQNPTMIFRLSGVDMPRFLAARGPDSIMDDSVSKTIQRLHRANEYQLPRAKIFLFETPRPNELLCNATRIIGRDGRELNAVLTADFTEAEIEGRKQVREYERFLRGHVPGCENAWLNDTGVQVGVRQTRQIAGMQTLHNTDVTGKARFASAIARSPWPIELHSGEKPQLVWLFDDYYEIPYECFVPEFGESILMAGRCLSAEHEAMASARVTAQCFSYGHAIGHAAVLAVRDRIAPRAISGAEIRALLNRDGAQLD